MKILNYNAVFNWNLNVNSCNSIKYFDNTLSSKYFACDNIKIEITEDKAFSNYITAAIA